MVENDSIGWYVAKTYRQERKIKDLLTRMGIEHFVPFHQVIKVINEYGYPMRYLRDFSTRSLLRVPDKQMEDFIYLVDRHENEIELFPHDLKRGDRVRVVAGTFAGIEGELIRIAGHRRVVVRLENLFSIATVFIPGGYLEKICDR